jgi:hypothetical protein
MEHLSKDKRKKLELMAKYFTNLCMESFTTRHFGVTIQKAPPPKPMLQGETNTLKPKVTTTADINNMLNPTIHHTLINQFGVLVNTLQKLIKQMVDRIVCTEPDKGPTYFDTSGFKEQHIVPKLPKVDVEVHSDLKHRSTIVPARSR